MRKTVINVLKVKYKHPIDLRLWIGEVLELGTSDIHTVLLEEVSFNIIWFFRYQKEKKKTVKSHYYTNLALGNGSIGLWNAKDILDGKAPDESMVMDGIKHSGPAKSVEFNPLRSDILASGGSRGNHFIIL